MTLNRRQAITTVAAATSLAAMPRIAQAQSYPARPVRFVVGFPPGGPNDILARIIGEWLSQRLGQPFTIENKPGQSSNLATADVVRAPADGHTIMLVGPANAINATMTPNLPYNFLRDIAPVGGLTREALVLVTHPSVPVKSAAELIAHIKANPGKVRMASTGVGSSPHVTGELFKMMAGVTTEVIHYGGGGPALKAMIAGEAEMMFEPMSASIGPVRKGQLRALAVTTSTRSDALPEVPILADAVSGFEASAVTGIGVPKDTPSDIVDKLNREINAAFTDPKMKARFAETGGALLLGSPADFGRVLAAETAKWGKVVVFAKGASRAAPAK